MLLFRSEEHVEAWTRSMGMSRGATLTLDQQWELARIWYGDRLATADARGGEAVFAGLGLTGEFWRLTG